MCDCVKMTNDALKERGIRLVQAFILGPGAITASLYIDTEKIYRQDRKAKTAKIMVSYCPFCVEKLKKEGHDG